MSVGVSDSVLPAWVDKSRIESEVKKAIGDLGSFSSLRSYPQEVVRPLTVVCIDVRLNYAGKRPFATTNFGMDEESLALPAAEMQAILDARLADAILSLQELIFGEIIALYRARR
jgi:hypothetical protein